MTVLRVVMLYGKTRGGECSERRILSRIKKEKRRCKRKRAAAKVARTFEVVDQEDLRWYESAVMGRDGA